MELDHPSDRSVLDWSNFIISNREEASLILVAVHIASNGSLVLIITLSFPLGEPTRSLPISFCYINSLFLLFLTMDRHCPNMGFFIFITVQGLMCCFIPTFSLVSVLIISFTISHPR